MWPYWVMYFLPASVALFFADRRQLRRWPTWLLLGAGFAVLIGYRLEVGADWWSYLDHFEVEVGAGLWDEIYGGRDPGYAMLNRVVALLGGSVHEVNLIAGTLFMSGLIVFCRSLPRPWLAFTVAVPYLVVVVAMGYTRQAIAIGFIFWALTYLERGRFLSYIAFIAAATLFHRTALIMIPLGLFLQEQRWYFRALAVTVVGFVLWDLFLAEKQQQLWEHYVERQMQSEGAQVRVMMNAVPALLLLLGWKRWRREAPNPWLWWWMAVAALVSVPLVGFASTAVDRLGLYLTPLQVAVFSRLPSLWRRYIRPPITAFGIVTGYALVLFVWLNYALHAEYWVPYRNVLLE